MKKTVLLTIVAVCGFVGSSLQAALNLVQDPGFEGGETGTLTFSSTPWFNPSGNGDVAITGSNSHSGNFKAALTSQTGESAILLQNLTLTAGVGYTINFWAETPAAGGTLAIDLNGVAAGTVTIAPGSVYTEYNLSATPVDSTGVLSFIWNTTTPPSTLYLDDISVAVPEPTTMVAGALMLLPFAASTFRRRKNVQA